MAEVQNLKRLVSKLTALQNEIKKKSSIVVRVGYTAAYTLPVHENIEMKGKGLPRRGRSGKPGKGYYWDPQGKAQAKFLEQPARTHRAELARIVREVYVKTKGNLELALKTAGLRLQRESMQLVPVDTGNLRASAFTRADYELTKS